MSHSPHRWSIHLREYERHEARRGCRHAYRTIAPRRAALVVVDMIRFFVDQSQYAQGIVPNINRLAASLRSAGGAVAWVVPQQGAPSQWQADFYGERVAGLYARSGEAGEPRDRLAPNLQVMADDLIVEKSAASAFFPGRSRLHALLTERGITSVIIAGTVTSVCCESTARDAATLGYEVIFAADATADGSDEAHNASLRTIYRSFGDVRPTSDILDLVADSSGGSTQPNGAANGR